MNPTPQKPVGDAFLEQAVRHLSEDFLPKIRASVRLLDEGELWWRPNPHCNSVGNLILHLCGNVRQWIISGIGDSSDTRMRQKEFDEKGPIAGTALLEMLDEVVGEASMVLEAMDRAELLKLRHIQAYEVTALQAVFHAVEHFSYHTGQIIQTAKSLKDVDLQFYDL